MPMPSHTNIKRHRHTGALEFPFVYMPHDMEKKLVMLRAPDTFSLLCFLIGLQRKRFSMDCPPALLARIFVNIYILSHMTLQVQELHWKRLTV